MILKWYTVIAFQADGRNCSMQKASGVKKYFYEQSFDSKKLFGSRDDAAIFSHLLASGRVPD